MQIGHVSDEHLSALIDQQLSATERHGIDEHLAECSACTARLEQLRRTVALVQRVPEAAIPRSFLLADTRVQTAGAIADAQPLVENKAAAPVRRPLGSATWLRVCSGLAAAMMIILLVGDAARPAAPVSTAARSAASAAEKAQDATTPASSNIAPEAPSLRNAGASSARNSAAPTPEQSQRDEVAPAAGAPASAGAPAAPPQAFIAPQPSTAAGGAPREQPTDIPVVNVVSPREPSVAQMGAIALGIVAIALGVASFLISRRR